MKEINASYGLSQDGLVGNFYTSSYLTTFGLKKKKTMCSIEEKLEHEEKIKFWSDRYRNLEKRVDDEISVRGGSSSSLASHDDTVIQVNHSNTTDLHLLKQEIQTIQAGLSEVKNDCSKVFLQLSEEIQLDRQYSRKNSILLHGYQNNPKGPNMSKYNFILATCAELNYLFPAFKGIFNPLLIDDAHPLPTRRNTGNMVVVKFKNRWLKRNIIEQYAGRTLRKPAISVSEHLIPYTRMLKSATDEVVGASNCRIEETVVHADVNGRTFSIKYARDIDRLKRLVEAQALPNDNNFNATPPATDANAVPLGSPRTKFIKQLVSGTELPNPINSAIDSQAFCTTSNYLSDYPEIRNFLSMNCDGSKTTNYISSTAPAPRGYPSRNGRGGKSAYTRYRGSLGFSYHPNK